MKRWLIVIGVIALCTLANAQACKSFIDQVPTEKTGAKGTVTFDGGTLKMCDFEDTSPNLKKGAEIELLSPRMVKDKTSWSLSHVKVKVIDDNGTGTHNGKIGYMYPASTSFASYADYGTERIDLKRLKDGSSIVKEDIAEQPIKRNADLNFLDQVPTEKTGVKGTVTYDGGTLKQTSFEDTSPNLDRGTEIELLSPVMLKDNTSIGLHHIKVKILEGHFKGEIGFMYPSSTSFSEYTDYNSKRIRVEDAKDAPVAKKKDYDGDFIDRVATEKTGCTGIVTFDGGTLKMSSFDDSRTHLVYGSKIELLSHTMIKEDGGWGLYHIKVKITDDLESGKHNGKIGYMYPASTSFSPYANYSAEYMDAPKGFTPDTEKKDKDDVAGVVDGDLADGSFELPSFANEKTGITGAIDGTLGDAWAYAEGSDWSKEVHLKNGTKFDLLSRKIFKDAITKYYFIKVKVTLDPDKTYTGKVMWVNVDETTINNKADKTDLTIK